MDLDLIQWDTTTRGMVFGTVFLAPLLAALWVWYDGSGARDSGRWAWRIVLTATVLATIPALVLGAASVDADEAQLLDRVGLLAFGAAGLALVVTVGYAASGRPSLWPGTEEGPRGRDPWASLAVGDALEPSFDTTLGSARIAANERAAGIEPEPIMPVSPAAPVAPAPSEVRAVVVVKSGPDQGRQIALTGTATVGRDKEATISLADSRVSTRHAEIRGSEDGYVFIDLASTNGSYLLVEGREERIRRPQRLVDGDEIRVGRTVVQFIQVPGGRAQ